MRIRTRTEENKERNIIKLNLIYGGLEEDTLTILVVDSEVIEPKEKDTLTILNSQE